MVDSLGSYLVITTYIPFFIVALIAYVVLMNFRPEIRIERLSKKEIIEMTLFQQIILMAVYISIFFVLHEADAISRIVVGFFLIFGVTFCSAARIIYHEYCHSKLEAVEDVVENESTDKNNLENGKVRHVYIVGSKSIG